MSGLDDRGAFEPSRRGHPPGAEVILRLGDYELEPVPAAILSALGDLPPAARRALSDCFLAVPLLWSLAPAEPTPRWTARLAQLARDLDACGRELAATGAVSTAVCAAIVGRWRDLTREAVRRLEALASRNGGARAALGDYRRRMAAPVAALAQLLPSDDELARAVRARLDQAEETLLSSFGVERGAIETASWTVASREADTEPGFVTWGIP